MGFKQYVFSLLRFHACGIIIRRILHGMNAERCLLAGEALGIYSIFDSGLLMWFVWTQDLGMRRCVVQHDMHLSVLFSEDPVRCFQCRLWQRLHPNHITVGQNQAIQHPLAVSTHFTCEFHAQQRYWRRFLRKAGLIWKRANFWRIVLPAPMTTLSQEGGQVTRIWVRDATLQSISQRKPRSRLGASSNNQESMPSAEIDWWRDRPFVPNGSERAVMWSFCIWISHTSVDGWFTGRTEEWVIHQNVMLEHVDGCSEYLFHDLNQTTSNDIFEKSSCRASLLYLEKWSCA